MYVYTYIHAGFFTFIITNTSDKKVDIDEIKKKFLKKQNWGWRKENNQGKDLYVYIYAFEIYVYTYLHIY
jgi:hypothetical protein